MITGAASTNLRGRPWIHRPAQYEMSRTRRKIPALPSERLRRSLLRGARQLAEHGAEIAVRRHRPRGQTMQRKGEGDFVTAVDLSIERQLRREIRAGFPNHGILGEEGRPHRPEADFQWILDPIDGTSNFGRGLPTYAISVACFYRGYPLAVAMHCLPEAQSYLAAAGLGAWCGRQRLRMEPGRLDDGSILGLQWHRGPRELEYLPALTHSGTRIRNLGCTVSQLCAVAAGRLDGNVQEQGKIWDFAAAGLLVIEAGGRFTDWTGRDIFPLRDLDPEAHHPSLAAAPRVHRQLVRILAPHSDAAALP